MAQLFVGLPDMEISVKTTYDKSLNAHLASIRPPLAAVTVTVYIDRYDFHYGTSELFLYNFDVDSNCIEFAFGEKIRQTDGKKMISYNTYPDIHVPPFRIQIMHQEQSADLSKYDFTVSYQLLY